MKVDLTVKYKLGHSLKETWEKTSYFCPLCGVQNVWREDSVGDYYVGEQYICVDCISEFNLPCGIHSAVGFEDDQRIKQIKESV